MSAKKIKKTEYYENIGYAQTLGELHDMLEIAIMMVSAPAKIGCAKGLIVVEDKFRGGVITIGCSQILLDIPS